MTDTFAIVDRELEMMGESLRNVHHAVAWAEGARECFRVTVTDDVFRSCTHAHDFMVDPAGRICDAFFGELPEDTRRRDEIRIRFRTLGDLIISPLIEDAQRIKLLNELPSPSYGAVLQCRNPEDEWEPVFGSSFAEWLKVTGDAAAGAWSTILHHLLHVLPHPACRTNRFCLRVSQDELDGWRFEHHYCVHEQGGLRYMTISDLARADRVRVSVLQQDVFASIKAVMQILGHIGVGAGYALASSESEASTVDDKDVVDPQVVPYFKRMRWLRETLEQHGASHGQVSRKSINEVKSFLRFCHSQGWILNKLLRPEPPELRNAFIYLCLRGRHRFVTSDARERWGELRHIWQGQFQEYVRDGKITLPPGDLADLADLLLSWYGTDVTVLYPGEGLSVDRTGSFASLRMNRNRVQHVKVRVSSVLQQMLEVDDAASNALGLVEQAVKVVRSEFSDHELAHLISAERSVYGDEGDPSSMSPADRAGVGGGLVALFNLTTWLAEELRTGMSASVRRCWESLHVYEVSDLFPERSWSAFLSAFRDRSNLRRVLGEVASLQRDERSFWTEALSRLEWPTVFLVDLLAPIDYRILRVLDGQEGPVGTGRFQKLFGKGGRGGDFSTHRALLGRLGLIQNDGHHRGAQWLITPLGKRALAMSPQRRGGR